MTENDGSVRPKATRANLRLSGGGDSMPLATLSKDGREIALTWSGGLPQPVLQGDTATYPEVLPGVDLKVIADVDSFSHVLVVKNAEAAKNPALAKLTFGLTGKGVEVKSSPDGTLTAVNPAGQTVFEAPPPKMWDSTGTGLAGAVQESAPIPTSTGQSAVAADSDPEPGPVNSQPPVDPIEGAADGAKQADLTVALRGESLELTTDQALLTAPDTVFPVVIDPEWRDDYKNAYSIAYKHNAFPSSSTTPYWNGGTLSKEARVGCAKDAANGNQVVCANTFFKIDVRNLWDKHILSSTLRIQQKYAGSWDCKSGAVEVWGSDVPTPANTWANQPTVYTRLDSSNVSFGGRNCPTASGDQLIEMNVTSAIAQGARERWTNGWGFRLNSATNTVDVSWRKFDPATARISTNFNTPPLTPWERSTDPYVPCAGGTFGLTDHVTLRARVSDAETNQVTGVFHYWKKGNYAPVERRQAAVSGNAAGVRIASADLQSGTYVWDVAAFDGTSWSAWAGQCEFTIDKDRPSKRPTVTSPQFPNGDGGTQGQPARTLGSFTFGANGVGDVTRYEWYTDTDTKVRSVNASGAGGPATISYKPLNAGPLRMYVTSFDGAGNRSDTTAYLFYATRSAARDLPGDLNGDGNTDMWAVEKDSGQLKFHPGQGNGGFGIGQDASSETYAGASITYRGDLGEDGYQDLMVLRRGTDGTKSLYAYTNRGDGVLKASDTSTYAMKVYDAPNQKWSNADQVLSLGSVNDDVSDPPSSEGQIDDWDYADFLVRTGDELWLYQGAKSAYLDEYGGPTLVGDAVWAQTTLMTPGDTNGDSLPELWVREDGTGKVFEYKSRKDDYGNLDPSAYGDPTNKVQIASGITKTAYPHLTTDGDIENAAAGTRYPDLWGTDPQGRIMEFPGQALSGGSAFGAPRMIVTSTRSWSDCQTVSGQSLCGPVLTKFLAMGGTTTFGTPVTSTLVAGDGLGRYASFSTGITIFWGPDTGVWAVGGAIRDRWAALDWERGPLGYPTSDEYDTPDRSGRYNTFSRAAIYWHPTFGAHAIYGAIHTKYREAGGFAKLGYPVTDEQSTPDNIGRFNHFRRPLDSADTGSIYWTQAIGAKIITGPVRAYWAANGWETGPLGYPHSDTYGLGDGVGQVSYFAYSGVYWTQATGAHRVFGNIFAKYLEGGGPSAYGYPTTDETGTPDGVGRYNVFSSNTSIYWSPNTGAHAVGGAIRDRWAQLGWEAGSFGYPTSDEFQVAGGARSDFQGGYIRWTASTNTAEGHTYSGGETSAAHITVTGDFNGDQRADLATVHDYKGGSAALWTSLTSSTGGAVAPFESWKVGPDNWWITSAKWVAGDFNNDGRDDIAALYRYGTGRVKLHTFTARTNGGFNNPVGGWEQATGWDWARTTLMAGNADGTGADELVAVQGTADGRYAIHTFTATATGAFNPPIKGYEETNTGWWYTDHSHFALGDANKDGRADIIGAHVYDDHTLKTFTSLAGTDGTYPRLTLGGWTSGANAWWHNVMQTTAGDTNGDGNSDLVVMYDYGNGDMGLWTFAADTNGNLTAPTASIRTGPNQYWAERSVPHTGDTNADGRDDLITLYRYNDGGFSRFVYTAQTSGGFNPKVSTWSAAPGYW
ncbi:FG-GAP-like repeat-containing protein [Yinghuangia sp. YIM S09857]|uniref:FG-GAP-like repeat-containing protein n=1 Tax=Yinghuangia sp. YIM S09857 TaxID=3436929 RepID=UPI003F532E53